MTKYDAMGMHIPVTRIICNDCKKWIDFKCKYQKDTKKLENIWAGYLKTEKTCKWFEKK